MDCYCRDGGEWMEGVEGGALLLSVGSGWRG